MTVFPSYSTVYTAVVHNCILNKESEIPKRPEIMLWTGPDLMPLEAGVIPPAYGHWSLVTGYWSLYYSPSVVLIQLSMKDFLCTRSGTSH